MRPVPPCDPCMIDKFEIGFVYEGRGREGVIVGYTELPKFKGSVETLHDEAEMPKRKSSRQPQKKWAVKVT